jgi:hypothetical protein
MGPFLHLVHEGDVPELIIGEKFMRMNAIMNFMLAAVLLSGCQGKSESSRNASVNQNNVSSGRKITLLFGPINRSTSIDLLNGFASKGVAEGDIANFISLAKLNKETVQGYLNASKELDMVEMDHVLNSSLGEAILKKVGSVLHPAKSKGYEVQALRSAIILSLVDDNKMSLIEVLNNLPVDMVVDVENLTKLQSEIKGFLQ